MESYIGQERIITLYRTEFTYTIERDEANNFLVNPGGKISRSFLDYETEEQLGEENNYNGNLENILKNGEATINYPNISEFKGFICCGLPYSGKMSYQNGDEFDGEFNENGIPRKGTLYYKDGNIFEGDFDKDGKIYNGELKISFLLIINANIKKESHLKVNY